VRITDFTVARGDTDLPIMEVPLRQENIKKNADDPELAEYMVGVRWEWTVPSGQGFWVKNLSSRRVTVAELRDPETSRKICAHAGLALDESGEAPG
jgi:hypothetical protein